jgi:hypothetical protein
MNDYINKYAEFLDDGYIPSTASRLASEKDNETRYDDYNGCPADIWN